MSEDPQELPESLRLNARDWGMTAFKAGAGVIPVLGPIAAALCEFLPAARLDRVVEYLAGVDRRLEKACADLDEIQHRVRSGAAPEAAALLERGALDAGRATSTVRLERLARIVADGLAGDERSAINAQRVLRTLDGIDDAEFALLELSSRAEGLVLLDPTGRHDRALPVALDGWAYTEAVAALSRLYAAQLVTNGIPLAGPSARSTNGGVVWKPTYAGNLLLDAALGREPDANRDESMR